MGLLEFNKLPINTLVGADWKTFKDITGGRQVDAAYKSKYRLTKAVCRLLSTLAPLQDKRYEKLLADKPLEHDPVLFWDIGVAGRHLSTMFFPVTSISATIPRTRRYFLI